MNSNSLDVVTLATVIAAAFWSPALASIIGPYAVIIIAANVGAAWSLGRREPENETRRGAFWFLVRINFMAILLTVLICNILEAYVFHREIKWALVPVSLAIGWVGDDWPKIFGWLTGVGKRLALRWASEKEKGDD